MGDRRRLRTLHEATVNAAASKKSRGGSQNLLHTLRSDAIQTQVGRNQTQRDGTSLSGGRKDEVLTALIVQKRRYLCGLGDMNCPI